MTTADVIERARAAERPAFPAEIPEWVPTCIADCARRSFEYFLPAEHEAMLVRLTTDPRMQSVWVHLRKRKRETGSFVEPTRCNLTTIADPAKRQDDAMRWLFCWVLEIAGSKPRALLRSEAEEIQRGRRALARKLFAEGDTLAYLEECTGSHPGRARILNDAACVLLLLSQEHEPGDIVVDRDRHKLKTRAAATAIAGACFWLFSKPLFTLTATMTAVALDCEVRGREVREWWSNQPIQPSADKGSFFGALSAVCKPRT
jgi:hypothetical protein